MTWINQWEKDQQHQILKTFAKINKILLLQCLFGLINASYTGYLVVGGTCIPPDNFFNLLGWILTRYIQTLPSVSFIFLFFWKSKKKPSTFKKRQNMIVSHNTSITNSSNSQFNSIVENYNTHGNPSSGFKLM